MYDKLFIDLFNSATPLFVIGGITLTSVLLGNKEYKEQYPKGQYNEKGQKIKRPYCSYDFYGMLLALMIIAPLIHKIIMKFLEIFTLSLY